MLTSESSLYRARTGGVVSSPNMFFTYWVHPSLLLLLSSFAFSASYTDPPHVPDLSMSGTVKAGCQGFFTACGALSGGNKTGTTGMTLTCLEATLEKTEQVKLIVIIYFI